MLYMRLLQSEFSCCYFHFLYLVTAGLGRGGAGGGGDWVYWVVQQSVTINNYGY